MNPKEYVLSLFGGMECGKIALDLEGISYEKYYSSEIDKYAIKLTDKIHENVIQLGDIKNWKNWKIDFSRIGLLLAGFPCQDFSVAGNQEGVDGLRGSLVYDLIDVWRYINKCRDDKGLTPVKFLFENVKMKKQFEDYINFIFEYKPVLIDSALVSAQLRKRNYWTNLGKIKQPKDRGILLKDIIHENTWCDRKKSTCLDASYFKGTNLKRYQKNNRRQIVFESLREFITPFDKTLQILEKEVEKGKVGYFRKDSQANRVYYINDKAITLCGDAGGGAAKMGAYLFGCVLPNHRRFKHKETKHISERSKFYTLTKKSHEHNGILVEGYIRKLTPIECGRLQTVPENIIQKMISSGISNTQLYKILGNGWTVEVIRHILKNLKQKNNDTKRNKLSKGLLNPYDKLRK